MVDFVRYLSAKRSVDDRALNQRVWERLRRELAFGGRATLRVVDVGAGIGTGAERMRDRGLVAASTKIQYTAVEPRRELLTEARRRLDSPSFEAFEAFETELRDETLETFARAGENAERFDLVVAHALVDILDLSPTIDALVRLARSGGLLYLPITFDGETTFEPSREEDSVVCSAYHGTMNEPGTGRRLFHALRSHRVDVLEMGSSDWIVHPAGEGAPTYPDDEAFFLRCILSTIEGAVEGRVDPAVLDAWMTARTRQVDEGELVYIAHQIDVLGRKRKETAPPCT